MNEDLYCAMFGESDCYNCPLGHCCSASYLLDDEDDEELTYSQLMAQEGDYRMSDLSDYF